MKSEPLRSKFGKLSLKPHGLRLCGFNQLAASTSSVILVSVVIYISVVVLVGFVVVGGSGVVRSFAHRKLFRKRGVDKEKRRALLKAQALFSCRLRVVFDTESRRRSESPERFLIPKDSILWILIGNTNAAGVVVLVVFPRARPRCSRRRTTTTRLLLLLLPFRRKRRRRKRRR